MDASSYSYCVRRSRRKPTATAPTTPTPAFKAGEKSDDPLQMYLSDIFTISCNLAGICGLSMPCGFSSNPVLPIGLQILGKPFGEQTILNVAKSLAQRVIELVVTLLPSLLSVVT